MPFFTYFLVYFCSLFFPHILYCAAFDPRYLTPRRVPEFVQEKRFANWLKDARDWSISRNRYWGTPIPLWVSDDGEEVIAISSMEELKELSGVTITDMHRESYVGGR